MSKKQNIIAGIQRFIKPRFTSRQQINQTNNPIRMIGDYINVKQKRKRPTNLSLSERPDVAVMYPGKRTAELNSHVLFRPVNWRNEHSSYPFFREELDLSNHKYESYLPYTRQKAVRNRLATGLGTRLPGANPPFDRYTVFPITAASRKSVSRYNNRQIRRNRENEPVKRMGEIVNIAYIDNPKKSRYNQGLDIRAYKGWDPNYVPKKTLQASVISPDTSMIMSPRRALKEYRLAQRYANAKQVEQVGRLLGVLGGATVAGKIASRYANNNPTTDSGIRSSAAMKRMSKRQAGPKPSKYF